MPEQAASSSRFEWALSALLAWWLGGLYFDGWAHHHVPELETFFTVWHAVFYTGFVAVATLTLGAIIRNRRRGYAWRTAIPRGYGLSVVGVPIFVAGTVGDLLWHEAFGIEEDVEALLSPTHLLLAGGMGLLLIGPLRAAWHRAEPGGRLPFPAVFSLAFLLSLFTFFTIFANPFGRPWAATGNRPIAALFTLAEPFPSLAIHPAGAVHSRDIAQSLGVSSIIIPVAIVMSLLLLVLLRWDAGLPPGSLTLIFSINALLMGTMRDLLLLVPSAVAAGLAADLLLRWLKPSAARPSALRAFGFAVPGVVFGFYFLNIVLVEGIWWTVHLWAGVILIAGIIGWLISYLVLPPPIPGHIPRE